MIKAKVIDIIRSFSRDDLKNFNDYICSPVFNKRQVIIKLFETYRKYYPAFDDKNLTKEKVFKKIFPDKEYNDEIFRNLNSILLTIAEDFLAFINYSNNSRAVKLHLLAEINFRNILPVFEKNFDEGKKLLEQPFKKDIEYFYDRYALFLQKDLYNSYLNKFSKDDIFEAERNLVVFFLTKMMEIQNYIFYECRLLGLDACSIFKVNFVDDLLKNIPDELKLLPQVQIYYHQLMLEQTDKEEHYEKLIALLRKDGNLFEKEKLYNMYTIMIDYMKRTRTKSDAETTSEIFQLRKEIIEKGLFTENFMTNMFFLNLVKSGLKLKEFEWLLNFIENYHHLIIDKYRESTIQLAYAYLHFEKKDFDGSLSHIAKVKYEDNFYNLEVRNMTARIYYETDRFDLLTDFVNSYRMYLSKNRSLTERDFNYHSLFIKQFNKLMRIKELKKYYKLDELLEQVNKKNFANRDWIIDKIKELEDL